MDNKLMEQYRSGLISKAQLVEGNETKLIPKHASKVVPPDTSGMLLFKYHTGKLSKDYENWLSDVGAIEPKAVSHIRADHKEAKFLRWNFGSTKMGIQDKKDPNASYIYAYFDFMSKRADGGVITVQYEEE